MSNTWGSLKMGPWRSQGGSLTINTEINVFPFKRNQILKAGFENICSVRQIDGTASGRGPPAVPSYCLTVNIFEASLEDLVAFDWEIHLFSFLSKLCQLWEPAG